MAVLQARALKKHFGRIKAVDGIDLTSEDGELLAVLGPSGSGKSTLMRMVAGLEVPDSGDVLVDGKSVVGIPPKRRNVAMVFQSFALYPHMSVRENIRFPLAARRVPEAEQQKKIGWVAEVLDIAHLLARRPTRLSGGEMQRTALARALIHDPLLVLADEPTGNLDSRTAEQVLELLARLGRTHGVTIVLVTHSREAAGMAERVVELRDGRVVRDEAR